WEFSKKFNLPVITVVKAPPDYKGGALFTGEGAAVNSELINGLDTAQAKQRIIKYLEEKGIGRHKITYKLRDWVFSRQRYWGEPIPVVHCPKCGVVPLPESELPLRLPEMKKFEPSGTGESPLANAGDWLDAKCPSCGGAARRETNTMPQWAGSCWYYLRFADPRNNSSLCSKEREKAWLPVDCYIGGSEHAVLHLLYARFWHKVLYDIGVVSTKEPFTKLRHQGMILSYSYRDSMGVYHPYGEIDFAESGPKLKKTGEALSSMVEKMSKSKKNVVNPDDILAEYGADAFRLYEMFMGPFDASKPWDMKGIEGVSRFLKRVWYWADGAITADNTAAQAGKTLESLRHKTIAKVSADIEHMHFNTAISALMIYFNELNSAGQVPQEHLRTFLTLLHPFAPHITEELWQRAHGDDAFLAREKWPQADAALLVDDELDMGVQVNGKLRGRVKLPAGADESAIKSAALENENVKRFLEGKTVVKVIVVPKKMVSVVVK
ncbi:MAG TPA: leucine--tRNA ligase, partial [Elusimicrobiales bacterium]|nr:leucine--tRNA ligase [Elusimicrobiales bacterium]